MISIIPLKRSLIIIATMFGAWWALHRYVIEPELLGPTVMGTYIQMFYIFSAIFLAFAVAAELEMHCIRGHMRATYGHIRWRDVAPIAAVMNRHDDKQHDATARKDS